MHVEKTGTNCILTIFSVNKRIEDMGGGGGGGGRGEKAIKPISRDELGKWRHVIDDVAADIVTGQAFRRHLQLHLILKNKKK